MSWLILRHCPRVRGSTEEHNETFHSSPSLGSDSNPEPPKCEDDITTRLLVRGLASL
jgi:hypothetical protein